MKEPAKTGAEEDVISRWRRLYCYLINHSPTAKIKRQIRRRQRRKMNQEINKAK
ncbi:hypothetical protein H5P28_11620 [Ruficoccus amylovorans]|uniref:Uncharacterized protein n=1 Tax=Ruficoccus amylovorans TaxID=1804625 RepID=A0A842HH08_9BACT|nr:hypothetical protein [Ruficoccus amylovorans]MBC2594906.1 hypothetical protein [Ruficoccus amylovorans]